MSKRKIIILYTLTIVVFVLSIMAVFGAFLFEEKVTVTANIGNISTINKGFVTYAPGTVIEDSETGLYTYEGISRDEYSDDESYIAALKTRSTAQQIEANSILCYATEKAAYTEEREDCFYLNQLGFRFDIASSIDVFVRIHFEDAWLLEKTVGGNTLDPQYIRKAQLNSDNYPFKQAAGNTDWYYDSTTNSVYYKHVIDSEEETATTDSSGNYIHTFSYDVQNNYFYINDEDAVINGHQAILVEVSFAIDVVQANRAYAIWGVDPLTIGS